MDPHAPQPMVPALGVLYAPLAPYAYAFMRFCVGAIIVPHGYTKLFQGAVAPAAGMIAKLGLEPAIAWAYFVAVAGRAQSLARSNVVKLGPRAPFASLPLSRHQRNSNGRRAMSQSCQNATSHDQAG